MIIIVLGLVSYFDMMYCILFCKLVRFWISLSWVSITWMIDHLIKKIALLSFWIASSFWICFCSSALVRHQFYDTVSHLQQEIGLAIFHIDPASVGTTPRQSNETKPVPYSRSPLDHTGVSKDGTQKITTSTKTNYKYSNIHRGRGESWPWAVQSTMTII